MYAVFETCPSYLRQSKQRLQQQQSPCVEQASLITIDTNILSMSWTSSNSQAAATTATTNPASATSNTTSSRSTAIGTNTSAADDSRSANYQEGWLATGNANAIIGCTFTTCLSKQQQLARSMRAAAAKAAATATTTNNTTTNGNIKTLDIGTNATANTPASSPSSSSPAPSSSSPPATPATPATPAAAAVTLTRKNFNLRGHKNEIKLVRWNETYQKLATCDLKGMIFVWIKYEGRWSIELINDRGTCVSDFAWSHDGRAALICYQDGYVLVGSVTGQRYWSNTYELSANSTIQCASWTPNDSQIVLGLSNGLVMLLDDNGTILSRHVTPRHGDSISQLAYNCPKFFVDKATPPPPPAAGSASSRHSPSSSSSSATTTANTDNSTNNNNNNPPAAAAASQRLRFSTSLFANQQLQNHGSFINVANANNAAAANNNNLLNQQQHHQNPLYSNNNNNNMNNNNNNPMLVNANVSVPEPKVNSKVNNARFRLACSFRASGAICLLKTLDDLDAITIETRLHGVQFEWSSCGKILAVGGYEKPSPSPSTTTTTATTTTTTTTSTAHSPPTCNRSSVNMLRFYDLHGNLLFRLDMPLIVS